MSKSEKPEYEDFVTVKPELVKILSKEEMNYLHIIDRNGKNLLNLINNILDLSKIESGRNHLRINPFSIRSTIEIIVDNLRALAEEKGIAINQNINSDLTQIESDEGYVHQILQNIIGNAVKFTVEGSVNIYAHNDEKRLYC